MLPVFALLGVLLLLNFVAQRLYFRLDLTKEGKFSLTPASKQVLADLDDVVFIKVYLEGDFPVGFKRLRNATQDMLDELRSYAGNNLQYQFIDPMADESDEVKKQVAEELIKKGLIPRRLIESKDGYSEKIFFPGAIATFRGREYPIILLQEQMNQAPETVINNSVAQLEYQLINAIQKLQRTKRPQIAFLDGHGELEEPYVTDIASALRPYYELHRVNLSQTLAISPAKYDALIVAKPTKTFEESNKFKLDQYVMNGGKIFWFIDPLIADIDSLNAYHGAFVTADYGLNLDDMLFKYGVRINPNLIQDLQCNPIPVVTGTDKAGNATQQNLLPWVYYPIFTQHNHEHPITKNLGGVAGFFTSSIDTIKTENPQKTILLTSSPYTKLPFNPVQVRLDIVKEKNNPALFNKGEQPVAVALEGKFSSVFKNRLAGETMQMIDTIEGLSYREESVPTKMIVCADGDFIRNEYDPLTSQTKPLGYYKFTKETFANKDFILNGIEWLIDRAGVIAARAKEVKMRLLDTQRLQKEQTYWQFINIVVPLVLLVVFGLLFNFWRRRKFVG